MIQAKGYAAQSATSPLDPYSFERRELGPRDIQIDILFCGVCHSDLHMVRNEWKGSVYPVLPGHEIAGRVMKVGDAVKGFKVGDVAAVGVMVDSCRTCPNCKENLEQYCNTEITFTYNSPDKKMPGKMTYGGYSNTIVVDEHFVLHLPANLDLAAASPLLCAGITTYSPLRHWKVEKGQKVGVVGLGGLGHMGVKFAHALGAETFVFTRTASKCADAKRLGAESIVVSTDEKQMAAHKNSFDFIVDTISAAHNLDDYTSLLKRDGTLCLVGVPEHKHPAPDVGNLLFKRRQIAGSIVGGLKETQEMLDFCGQHKIVCDIETIPMQKINEAYERMLKSDVKYRFVIDLGSL